MRARIPPTWRHELPALRAAAIVVGVLLSVLCLLTPRVAHADLKLDGRWRQSALREDFTVQQWLNAGCGSPPQSSSTGGGEIIDIRMEGDELAFVGGGRVYRTNQCYDPMPTLSRETHSRDASGKTWRTRCTTSPADPRKTVLNTLVVATTDRRIDMVETGRYEATLETGRCMADVKRTRSFELVQDDNTTPTATTAAPTTAPPLKDPDPPRPAACGSIGEPARLEVRPSKKLVRTGETFTFRSLVLDAKGCQTRTPTSWKIAGESETKGVTVDSAGTVTVAKDAGEASVEIIATAAGKDARVVVEVASPARYDELLARSGLNAAGENDEAASVVIASESLGAGEGRVEDRARERRMIFLAIIGGVLLVLGVVAVLLARRARRARELHEQADSHHEARVQQVLHRRRQREAEHAEQTRAHEESVIAARAAEARSKPLGNTVVMKAVPLERSDTAASAPPITAPRGKICPTCGGRFAGTADFCGKDGTVLVLLN